MELYSGLLEILEQVLNGWLAFKNVIIYGRMGLNTAVKSFTVGSPE
jgi:hypothetical protein